jgi:hypothetical protein
LSVAGNARRLTLRKAGRLEPLADGVPETVEANARALDAERFELFAE